MVTPPGEDRLGLRASQVFAVLGAGAFLLFGLVSFLFVAGPVLAFGVVADAILKRAPSARPRLAEYTWICMGCYLLGGALFGAYLLSGWGALDVRYAVVGWVACGTAVLLRVIEGSTSARPWLIALVCVQISVVAVLQWSGSESFAKPAAGPTFGLVFMAFAVFMLWVVEAGREPAFEDDGSGDGSSARVRAARRRRGVRPRSTAATPGVEEARDVGGDRRTPHDEITAGAPPEPGP